ncbi:hypothetical protein [Salibacterium qingdaonense]|uniref:Uncharacterized protein n=1 Tax=Salibacterium qingdaonense TaxID=266892 RepID=A0A1I4HU79_9BACI|nr:hypothetical protein [Salibacterium qingdaonense]SFL45702.1 hypothetical protein SAMN04488054_10119 [Salibacterium qingdaonense]
MKYVLYGTVTAVVLFVIIMSFRMETVGPAFPAVLLWVTVIIAPWVFLYWFIRFVKQYIKNSEQ